MSIFREQIRAKIANQALQSALDGNVERRMKGRATALASVPDWEARRQRAHAIRAEVIEHLDDYLETFSARVRANGITVQRAKDAAEAVQIVLDIAAKQKNLRPLPAPCTSTRAKSADNLLFAKSKSMVSEEIGLNHALEAAGPSTGSGQVHRVVETDLGEYIIQLRGERPSHIITPAVHLRRQDVGQLFHEKLGIPYTEDIPTLTNTARKVLREVFLTADIGISGVNFGVAETGTLTLVTNEGNGRMCTTLPPVHIALMGMERLVPTLDDLALFLSLLPRSATGQKLSVYTQLIHSPLPGQQRHLVIVDNGRSALRGPALSNAEGSPLKESLYCIRCGACLNACPVFREIGGHAYRGADGSIAPYPGPIGSVISPGLMGANFAQLAQASSLCGACKEVCPVDIDLPKMLLRVRSGKIPDVSARPGAGLPSILKAGLGMFTRIASHPRLYTVAQKLAGWFTAPLPGFLPLPAVTGWGLSKDFPKPAAKPFRAHFVQQGTGKSPDFPTPPSSAAEAPNPVPVKLSLIDQFTAELTALGGQTHPAAPDSLTPQLIDFLRSRNIDRVEMWDHVPELDAASLMKAGIRVEKSAPDLMVGITGALCAIAETGSLIVHSGAGRPLTASLVPPVHVAVIRASQILPTLEVALRLPEVAACAASAIITGPSRTADIEMTLTIGMHGPGEVRVFLVDDSMPE